MKRDTLRNGAALIAVLGPTNTGKTHLAMERMLAHTSGVIGFPLRLLARENYDRAVKAKGVDLVALVTGEEKIIPEKARYFLTTVESMPTDRPFAFAAIDEIQMCADPDRGHVFTDRLLNYRGEQETLFLGAATIKGLIAQVVPHVEFQERPRLSVLRYTGYKKLTRLKPRSCIVAFSINDVYSIAALVRRQSGGAAIVMGALSPRTRNAQVEMFQSGDVDYLVATDAVGMGLNMDVEHVALAATRKFDGCRMRALNPAELAQVAGRAGRHMNDGTFGTTSQVTGLKASTVEHIQNHTFKPLSHIFWRQADLDYTSLKALKASLAQTPEHTVLRRTRAAEDEQALDYLIQDETIAALAASADAVRTLWDVARIPDFSNIGSDDHPHLLGRIYSHLLGPKGRIPADWLAEQVKHMDSLDGDIDTLMGRIAALRTWTYVSHQKTWLDTPLEWQERTRAIEDRLSDALHEKLTERFVDQRTTLLAKTLKADQPLVAALHDDGTLNVEGHHLGHLNGLRFAPTHSESEQAAKVLNSAATAVLRQKISTRVATLSADVDGAFTFTSEGQILWRGEAVASFAKGAALLSPTLKILPSDLIDSEQKSQIETRLKVWADDLVRERLSLLLAARDASLEGVARGLVFQLTESLGALPRPQAHAEIKGLEREDRQTLRKLGIRIGRHLIYIPALLRPAAVELSVLLWAVYEDRPPLPPPPAGRVSLKREKHEPEGWLRAAGFHPAGPLFVRADMLERLAELAWKRLEEAKGPFLANEDFLALAGCGVDDLPGILKSLGFSPKGEEGTWQPLSRVRKKPAPHPQPTKKAPGKPLRTPRPSAKPPPFKVDPDSPFAKLQDLKLKT